MKGWSILTQAAHVVCALIWRRSMDAVKADAEPQGVFKRTIVKYVCVGDNFRVQRTKS